MNRCPGIFADMHENFHFITTIHLTARKMKFSIKDFFSKCFFSFLRICSHLLKKYLMENFIFCAVSLRTKSSTNYFWGNILEISLLQVFSNISKVSAFRGTRDERNPYVVFLHRRLRLSIHHITFIMEMAVSHSQQLLILKDIWSMFWI